MHYHIVGIAGAGMSASANLLLDQGHTVSGSDLTTNQLTLALAKRGAAIYTGHAAAHIAGADVLVATSAVQPDHPELVAAQETGIPLLRRADLWRDWSQQRPVIAVAGTHGKTTTTAMIALVLTRAGFDPGFLIGSESPDLGVNARWGRPDAPLVIEADEYDRTFLALTPKIAVITNIEWDHPDIYQTAADYEAAFTQFASQVQDAILFGGDQGLAAQAYTARWLTYGFETDRDYRAQLDRYEPAPKNRVGFNGAPFSILNTRLLLRVPGLHNIHNALAAIAVADLLGVQTTVTAQALGEFRGTARRFEFKGIASDVTVIDDYAHHPTEVQVTLATARDWATPGPWRIIAYLQPHTFSRTRTLWKQWPDAFANADLVLIGDIYAARESGNPSELARALVGQIAQSHPRVAYVGNLANATRVALKLVRPGDLFLTLGAGDGYRVGEELLAQLQNRE
ncbi:MAG: UDP-N-acetylmuramate--L-alanine ligase [Chloroflexales bacterium]|nr:UDP-N-acetylmuramate--L-alanine ligase [Chloroflexales bacterium]